MTDITTVLVSASAGAVFGYFTNYFIERFKRRSQMTDARRKAYASWFTAAALMLRRVKVVSYRIVGFPTDWKKHEALMIEIRSLSDEGRSLITAMNEAFLAEQNLRMRNLLSDLNNRLIHIVGSFEVTGKHYAENLNFTKNTIKLQMKNWPPYLTRCVIDKYR
jgi:hypothetical protein